jgi:hypothetical protein
MLTVIGVVIEQPVLVSVYLMFATPAATPLTTPVAGTTFATDASLVLHVPTPPSVRVVEEPTHTLDEPVIAPGSAFTVNGVEIEHPVGNV